MVHEVVGHGEGGFKRGDFGASTRIAGAVIDDGPAQGRDVLVLERNIPNHHFVNHSFEVGVASTVYAQLIQVDVVE